MQNTSFSHSFIDCFSCCQIVNDLGVVGRRRGPFQLVLPSCGIHRPGAAVPPHTSHIVQPDAVQLLAVSVELLVEDCEAAAGVVDGEGAGEADVEAVAALAGAAVAPTT